MDSGLSEFCSVRKFTGGYTLNSKVIKDLNQKDSNKNLKFFKPQEVLKKKNNPTPFILEVLSLKKSCGDNPESLAYHLSYLRYS